MRQTPSAALPGLCVLSLLLGSSALAQPAGKPTSELELATGSTRPVAQLIGWSPDEQRYAFRVFSHQEVDLQTRPAEYVAAAEKEEKKNVGRNDKAGFCKGYVDHQGQRFKGALRLIVFERDKQLFSLPIQDEPRCTPPETAAKRLSDAKTKLAKLGIDTARVGQELPLVSGQRLPFTPEKQPPSELEFVNQVKDTQVAPEVKDDTGRLQGTLELYVHRGGKTQTVLKREVDKSYTKAAGHQEEEGLTSAFVSPSGERMVVLGYSLTQDEWGDEATVLRMATFWGGAEGALPQGK